MRQIKLPHLPSDVEAQQSDLITDVWYKKGKETQIKQDMIEKKVVMKSFLLQSLSNIDNKIFVNFGLVSMNFLNNFPDILFFL